MKRVLQRAVAILLFGLVTMPQFILAQENGKITYKAQIRERSEVSQRDFNNDTDFNSYTYLRTRFGVLMTPSEDVTAFVQIQDSRVYGQETNTLASRANLDLHQAYVKVNHFLFNKLDIKLGRMELSYGDQRVIGAVGWHNVGRSFDGGVATINFTDKFKLDAFSARLMERSTPAGVATPGNLAGDRSDENDVDFGGLYGMYSGSESFQADFYLLAQIDGTDIGGENTLEQATLGTYLRGKKNSLSYKAELAFQGGKTRGADISAFMLTGAVTYALANSNLKPAFTLGYDYLSGEDLTDNKVNSFNTLFATNHKFYGYMDYFINVPAQSGGLGLKDMMVKVQLKPSAKWGIGAHFHNFLSAEDAGNGDNAFGQEIDLVGNYKFRKNFTWTAGLSFFIPGDLMKSAFGTEDLGFWSHSSVLFNF